MASPCIPPTGIALQAALNLSASVFFSGVSIMSSRWQSNLARLGSDSASRPRNLTNNPSESQLTNPLSMQSTPNPDEEVSLTEEPESSEVLESLSRIFDPSQLEFGPTAHPISPSLARQTSNSVSATPVKEGVMGTIHIDFNVFVVQDISIADDNTAKTRGKTGSGKLTPKPGETYSVSGPICSMTLAEFKKKVFKTIQNKRPLVATHMESIDASGQLKWHAYILQDRVFGKNFQHHLEKEEDFERFAVVAIDAGPKRVWCYLYTDDPKAKAKNLDAQNQAESLLVMRYGSPNERETVARTQLRQSINPRGDRTVAPSAMERLMQKGARMGAQWGVEKNLYINPRKPDEFFHLTARRALLWAQAIDANVSGVDEEHPPATEDFKWLPRSALHGTPLNKNANDVVVFETPMTPTAKRRRPMPRSPPAALVAPPHTPNKMVDFLEFAHVDYGTPESYEVEVVLNEHHIYHWSFFLDKTEDDLLKLGFKAGPAAVIPKFVYAYQAKWAKEALIMTGP